MPVYFLCGGLGSGKSLMAVSKMQEKLEKGLPVATNINLDLAKLVPADAPPPLVMRLPDFPTGEDLYALGEIPQRGDESMNGLCVLDEAGLYLNARDWNDKGRRHAMEWFLHSRKLGWDVIFLTQSFGMIDKQIRESLGEYVCTMRRWDRMMVPMLGKVGRLVTFGLWSGKLPRLHTAAVMYGHGASAMHADTWHLRGADLFGAYQTKQKFSAHYEHGLFSMLPGASIVETHTNEAPALARPPARGAVASPAANAPPSVCRLKPKRPEIAALSRIPRDHAWNIARRLAPALS